MLNGLSGQALKFGHGLLTEWPFNPYMIGKMLLLLSYKKKERQQE